MIKDTELFKKCREMCQNEEMFMPDQSAINKIAIAKKIEARKYNEQRNDERTLFHRSYSRN